MHSHDLSTYSDGERCPKLFILQACRGSKFDKGVHYADGGEAQVEAQKYMWLNVVAEAEKIRLKLKELFHSPQTVEEVDAGNKLPITADMLYAYSTVPGYFAWRNSLTGSCFIQTFIDVLRQQYKKDHLVDMLTDVNDHMAREFWLYESGVVK